jgi:hypothetical protein
MKQKLILLTLFVLLLVFLTGCGSQTLYMCKDGSIGGGIVPEQGVDTTYFCPNGKETTNVKTCTFTPVFVVDKKTAEVSALKYVQGYVVASGWQATLINVYQDEDWKAQIILSKRDQTGYETIVSVNGTTGTVTCETNCEYVGSN